MARQRKTKDEFIVQGNYGAGYEDLTCEDTRKEARQRLKEYNENEGYAHRIIVRRVKLDTPEERARRISALTGQRDRNAARFTGGKQ